MIVDWSPLRQELALWRAQERHLPIWWRDDDAVADTPALEQLSGLSATLGLPVHLAVIPALAEPSLAVRVAGDTALIPLVHGWAHQDHATAGQKKAEFGRPRAEAADELSAGLAHHRALFGARALPVFVPPWNRIDDRLLPLLVASGYHGLSTYAPRTRALPCPGLVQINAHLDPIFWRGHRGLVAPETLIAQLVTVLRDRRRGVADAAEPLGYLTHHLVHDAEIWEFSRAVLSELLAGGAVGVTLAEAILQAS